MVHCTHHVRGDEGVQAHVTNTKQCVSAVNSISVMSCHVVLCHVVTHGAVYSPCQGRRGSAGPCHRYQTMCVSSQHY